MEPPCEVGKKVYINGTGHKILKLGMQHWGLKLYKVYIYDDPWLTLTYFTARSNWVTCTFEWGKLLQSHFIEENLQQRTILTV